MSELKKTTDLVYDILVHNAATRDSDNDLYVKVLEYYGTKLGVNFNRVSAISFFNYYRRYSIPSIETVGRCRRKLQEEYDFLRADEGVERERMKRETEFRDYARRY